nr:DNA cytosine methyltransferase [Micromonospora sp. DSM 115978]
MVAQGLRPQHDSRRELWQSFLDVVIALRPRTVLMENVPDMALGDHLHAIRVIVGELEHNGYHTEISFMETWRHGVPQHRRRLILLARRDGEAFAWPRRFKEPDATTVGDAISDLPPLGLTTGARRMQYSRPTDLGEFAKWMRVGAEDGVVHDHMTRPVRDDDREIFGLMTSKMLYTDVPERLQRYATNTFDDKYKRLDLHELSRTITAHIAKDGYWYI